MTLADTRTAVPKPLVADSCSTVDGPASLDSPVTAESTTVSSSQLEMMRAFFCYEFEVDRLDLDSLPEATPEAVAEWVDALAMSGLFAPTELHAMSSAWLSEPEVLIHILSGADEVAARRDVAESDADSITPESPASLPRAS